jgi:hypothetical protein
MAERRMFAKTIIDSDAFLDMPLSTQSLYFHLSMRADDEGFINNPKKIQRMIGASDDDLKLLMLKSFLIPFDSGIVVIKHWRIHNYIQKDRFKETLYQEEKAMLSLKDNNAYTLAEKTLDTSCIHDGYITDTQDSIGKVSIVEDSIGKVSIEEKSAPKKPAKEKYGELGNVKLTIDEYDKLVNDYGYDLTQKAIKFFDEYIADKGYKSKSNYMAMKRWVFDAVKEQEAKKAKGAPKTSTFDDAMQRFLAKGDN